MDDAEFVLAHGTECLGRPGDADPVETTLDEIRVVLEAAAKRGLPLLIANPDIVTVSGSGLVVMPGTFGRWYKEMGGQVSMLPHRCPQLSDGPNLLAWHDQGCLRTWSLH